jgi:hypothetical protein
MSTATVSTARSSAGLLRIALKLDAVVTGANGLAYVALANVLDSPLGIPSSTLRSVGVFLLLFAAAVWSVSTRGELSRLGVSAVIAANVLWVVDSLLYAALGWDSPEALGTVWVVLQAIVVAGFAAFQGYAWRRLT